MAMAQHPQRWTIWRVIDPTGRGFDSSWSVGSPNERITADELEVVEVVPALAVEALREIAHPDPDEAAFLDYNAAEEIALSALRKLGNGF